MPLTLDIKASNSAVKYEDFSPNLVKKFRKGIVNGSKHAGASVVKEVRRMLNTGRRTGIKYPNLPNRSSAPGEPPRTQSGRLAKSAGFKANNPNKFKVLEGAPYARRLEEGDENVSPRPHLKKAIDKKERTVEKYLQDGPYREIKS